MKKKIQRVKIWKVFSDIHSSHRQKSNRTIYICFLTSKTKTKKIQFFSKKMLKIFIFEIFWISTCYLWIIVAQWIFEIYTHLHDEKTSIFSKVFDFCKIFWICLFSIDLRPFGEKNDIFQETDKLGKKSGKQTNYEKNFSGRDNMKSFL